VNVTVITVLRDGTHLEYWREIDGDSIEVAAESVISAYVNDRIAFFGKDIKRLVVIAGDLVWRIDPAQGQHLMYRRAFHADDVFGPAPKETLI
jgi:hypothetical protein